jgi:hypothetical protein
MIPPKVIRFLEDRASIGFAASRDDNLVPRGHRVSGWQTDSTGRTITVFVAPAWTAGLVDALRSNGRIAITIEEVGTHETYQIKGRYVSDRAVRPEEIEIANRARERFVRALLALLPGEPVGSMLGPSIPTPSLAVAVEVQEVFLQTPGPAAGRRIAPPPETETAAG